MSSYNYNGDPSSSDIDLVRFLVFDTQAPWKLSDEEIGYMISAAGNGAAAAGDAAELIGSRLTTKADKRVGPLRIQYSDQAKSYLALAQTLRQRYAMRNISGPVLTQTLRDPLFTVGMHDKYSGWLPPQVSYGPDTPYAP